MMMVMMMITVVVAIELMTDEVPACVCKVSKMCVMPKKRVKSS